MPKAESLPHKLVLATALYPLPFSDPERRGNCETSKHVSDIKFFMDSQMWCPWQGTVDGPQRCGRCA